jgi:hypothetical protein
MKWGVLLAVLVLTSCLSEPDKGMAVILHESMPVSSLTKIQEPDDLVPAGSGFILVTAEPLDGFTIMGPEGLIPDDFPEYIKTETVVRQGGQQQQGGQKQQQGSSQEQQKREQQEADQSRQQLQQQVPAEELAPVIITTVRGKPFTVGLPDKGWVYMPDAKAGDAVRFMDKQYSTEGTLFVFQVSGGETRILSFERQDNITGLKQTVKVTVKSSDGTVTETVGTGTAITVMERPAEDDRPAVIRLEEAVAAKDLTVIDEILSNPDLAAMAEPDLLLRSWRILESRGGNPRVRGTVLDRLLELYPDDMDITPELLYFRAVLMEANTSQKNLKKAYAMYNTVYSRYPVSPWSGKAHERMIYLDRHYFKVR